MNLNSIDSHLQEILNYQFLPEGIRIDRFFDLVSLVKKGIMISLSKTLVSGYYFKAHGAIQISRHQIYQDAKELNKDKEIPEGSGFANVRIEMSDHAGTHLDSLNHVAEKGLLFGGIKPRHTYLGFEDLDIEKIPPIFTRGILINVKVNEIREIGVTDLAKALGNTKVEKGDAAIIYTGWKEEGDEEPGIGIEGAKWLVEKGFTIFGTDAPRFEYIRKNTKDYFQVHRFLIAEKGLLMIDNMYLEELVKLLEKENIKDFLLIAIPIKIKGATASPINPIALI